MAEEKAHQTKLSSKDERRRKRPTSQEDDKEGGGGGGKGTPNPNRSREEAENRNILLRAKWEKVAEEKATELWRGRHGEKIKEWWRMKRHTSSMDEAKGRGQQRRTCTLSKRRRMPVYFQR